MPPANADLRSRGTASSRAMSSTLGRHRTDDMGAHRFGHDVDLSRIATQAASAQSRAPGLPKAELLESVGSAPRRWLARRAGGAVPLHGATEIVDQRIGSERRREVTTLARVAFELRKPLRLLLPFDALSHDGLAEAASDLDDGLDQGAALRHVHLGDEGVVDLDLVDRQLLKVAQRGIALPEVVDRQTDASVGAGIEEGLRRAAVRVHQQSLGDLELQAVRRELPAWRGLHRGRA